ncbi:tape measure protein [uncultured Actinomyces sp.]|uniref:tape measure protein n=1 Tax=uncultured Actinomyces sp. TaxID=249061 RepID=UPI0028E1FECE|nr:tape measure protein [uncultured Actinomyces sp.]
MAGVYQAGTVYVDVVPSMRGFFKSIENATAAQIPQVAGDAGKKYAEKFKEQVSASGKDLVNAVADPLGKSTARLRQEAAQAGAALQEAHAKVEKSSSALAKARAEEETAATAVERAERALASARSSSSADSAAVARAESALASAREASAAANKKADQASANHADSLRKEKVASDSAKAATEALDQRISKAPSNWERFTTSLKGWVREADNVEREAREVDSSLGLVGSGVTSLGGLVTSALGPLALLGAAVGIGGFASEAIAASDATNKFADTLRFAGVDDSKIKELGASAQEYADRTVYDLADIQGITSQLAANGVDGFDRLAEAAGNLNAVSGGTADTYKSLGLALVQVNGAGKLQTQDWNQVANAIPGASGKIQKALSDMGAYTGNFREAMAEGQISAEEFNQALLQLGFDDVAVAAASDVSRIENAAGNLQATIVGGFKDMIDLAKPQLTAFMSWLSDTLGAGFAWIKDVGVPSIQGIWDVLANGNFSGPIFGLEEDSGLVDYLFNLRDAGMAAWEMLKSGWDAATNLAAAFAPLAQSVWDVISAFGGDGPSVIQRTAEALKAVFDWVGKNTDIVAPLVTAVVAGTVAFKGMSAAMGAVNAVKAAGGLLQFVKATKLAKAAQAAFNVVMNMNSIGLIVTAIAALVAGLVYFFTQTETGRKAWAAITEAFYSFVDWISSAWSSAMESISSWWTGTWDGVSGFFSTYVVQPLQTAWEAITAVWDGIVTVFKTAFAIIVGIVLTPIKLYIQAWVAVFTWAYDNVIKPVWDAICQAFTWAYDSVIKPVFEQIASTWQWIAGIATEVFGGIVAFLEGVWASISAGVTAAWNLIVSGVTWYINTVWSIVSTVFTTVAGVVSSIWNGIASTVSGVWESIKSTASAAVQWVYDSVTGVFSSMSSGVSSTFDGMKTAIETVWNKVKGVAAKPVNFIIDTVYTNGLKSMVETVASKIGLSLTLPTVPRIAEYAGGGIVPGYSPGHDTIPAMLSPGEAILVPELVRQIGPSRIIAANYAASKRRPGGTPGKAPAGFSGGGIAHFAGGGIAGWFADAAKGVAEFFADPVGSTIKLVTEPVRALMKDVAPGVIGELGVGGVEKLLGGVADFFKKKTGEASSAGLVGAAMRAVQMQVPYVWGGSAIPPGLDCSGLVYWAAQQLGLGWPRLTAAGYQSGSTPIPWTQAAPGDLLFWGAPAHHVAIYAGGGQMIEEPKPGLNARHTGIWGAPTVGRYGGTRKYDRGGWLPSGVTAAVNQTGTREAILTARQWADVSALAASGANAVPSFDGAQVNLVLDDGQAFRAHVESISTGVLVRRKQLAGRSR